MTSPVSLGLDFGTESVRALVVGLDGVEHGSAVAPYRHGQIVESLPGSSVRLPPDYALQHPQDWIDGAAEAARQALSRLDSDQVVGIGVDFTSCTMLPTQRDGTPVCFNDRWASTPLAWPKLWKHHGAKAAADRINRVARERREAFLDRYGGTIGLEWFFPKILETLDEAPEVFDAAEVWLEAGDWFVWQLVGGDAPPRSTCQAGYKGIWSAEAGFPTRDFLTAVRPRLGEVVDSKLPGRLIAPGVEAGKLTAAMADRLGLRAGIPVSAAIIDAHAGVPGAGAADPGTLVMVLGTSACHMLNAVEARTVPGVAGVVKDGILPGFYGYETGQAAVGDAFDWCRRLAGQSDFASLLRDAERIPPGSDGVAAVDWFNGCRTPLMDARLTGSFHGLKLHHKPAHLFRALIEATAFGLRWIVELLREHGVPVREFIATGGLPFHNPLLLPIYADVLDAPIIRHPSKHGSALGAAVLGALAAGRFDSPREAIRAMSMPRQSEVVEPSPARRAVFDESYRRYRELARQAAEALTARCH